MVYSDRRLEDLQDLRDKLQHSKDSRLSTTNIQKLENIKNDDELRELLVKEFRSFPNVGKWCYEEKFAYHQRQLENAIQFYEAYLWHQANMPGGDKEQEEKWKLELEADCDPSIILPSDNINVLNGNIIFDDNIKRLLATNHNDINTQNALFAYNMFASGFTNFYLDDIGRIMARLISEKTQDDYAYGRDFLFGQHMIVPNPDTHKSDDDEDFIGVGIDGQDENMSFVFNRTSEFEKYPYVEIFMNHLIRQRLSQNMGYITYRQMNGILTEFIDNEKDITKSLEPSQEAKVYALRRKPIIHPYVDSLQRK